MNYMGTHSTHRYTVSSRFSSVPFNSVSVRNQTCFPVNEGNHLAFQRKNAKLDFFGLWLQTLDGDGDDLTWRAF